MVKVGESSASRPAAPRVSAGPAPRHCLREENFQEHTAVKQKQRFPTWEVNIKPALEQLVVKILHLGKRSLMGALHKKNGLHTLTPLPQPGYCEGSVMPPPAPNVRVIHGL